MDQPSNVELTGVGAAATRICLILYRSLRRAGDADEGGMTGNPSRFCCNSIRGGGVLGGWRDGGRAWRFF